MAAGDTAFISPIVAAIRRAEAGTTGEIRVHLSKRWIERDPMKRAGKIFAQHGMERTTHRNAVLLYVNLRRRKFAVYGDQGIHAAAGQEFWNELSARLKRELHSTYTENAIASAVLCVGEALATHFPAEGTRTNELPDDLSTD